MKQLSLLVPGLLGPLPELSQSAVTVPPCAVMETWLARGDEQATQAQDYFQQLARLLSIHPDFSIARVSAMVDGFDTGTGYWYRADPVHFRADMDHAILLDQHMLDLDLPEAEALIQAFNQHYRDAGVQLQARHPARWYLHSATPLRIRSTRLHAAIGRNVTHFLPQGEHALRWRRLLNETQMLFHTHPVNVTRDTLNRLTINSLWLWGEGEDMHYDDHRNFQWLMANEPVARGLANILGLEHHALEAFDALAGLQGNGLLIIDDLLSPASYGDVERWAHTLDALCEHWFGPLQSLLRKGVVKHIDLYPADGRRFRITARSRFRYWRRLQPITRYIHHAA